VTSVTIPNSVISINTDAFEQSPSLTSVTIGDGVIGIGAYAFNDCASLTSITIPRSVLTIFAYAFSDCTSLTSVYFMGNAPAGFDGVFEGDNNVTVYYLAGTTGWGEFGNGEGVPAVLWNTPPSIDITSPTSSSIYFTTSSSPIRLGGTASDSIVNVTWSNPQTGGAGTASGTFSWTANNISLAKGANVITVTAYDAAGDHSTVTLIVTVIPSLQVTINPAAVIAAGAKWQVDFGTWQNSGATVFDLSVGNHTISFNTVSGWNTPANQIVVVSANRTATTSGTYVEIGSLQVTISPAAAVIAGAQWQVDGGAWQNSGASVPNLSVGNHTVSFKTISGWTTPANQTVSIKAKSVAKARATYTFSAQGIYNGLFMQTDVTEETAGMLSGLDVTASGTYTGKLLIGGSAYGLNGGFDVSGQASNHVQRTAKLGGPLTLEMTLNWNDSPPEITGTVSGTNGGAWVANLTNELAAKGSTSAEYTTLVLPDATLPGYGYMLITNHAGAVTLSGALADGTSFSQNVPLSGVSDLPVYGNLYGGTGLLLGWLSLESGSPTGNLTWIKQASRSTARYTNGFTNLAVVQGSLWTNPLPRTAAIDLPAGQLDISGGSLRSSLSFNVALSNNNALVKLAGSPTNSLTGSINPKSGLLTVTFGNGAGKAKTAGKGAVLQNAANAGGFFLGKTNAGLILLQP
jgi:hypothetical protein